MKINLQKSNNPLAVGALLCVLALVIGRTIWLVMHGDTASASTVVKQIAAVPTPPGAAAAVPVSILVPRSQRNPFSSQTRVFVAADTGDRSHTPRTPDPDFSLNVRPIPPFPVALPASRLIEFQGVPTRQIPRNVTTEIAPSPLQGLKLTAIVSGVQAAAVVEASQTQSFVVHKGDHLLGMRVDAIHERDVVFARGADSWTLALQSADPTATVSAVAAEEPPTGQENADVPN